MESQPTTTEDRLDGWDAISDYLGWHKRTVIRWEKQKGLPVHRVAGGRRQPVYAYKRELDLWFKESGALALVDAPTLGTLDLESEALPYVELDNTAPSTWSRSRWLPAMATIASLIVCGLLFATLGLRPTVPDLTAANPIRITQSQTHILSPLMTDGVRVFFPQYENSRFSVATVPVQGGQSVTAVTDVANPELCDLAQGSQAMLLRDLIHSRDENAPVYIQTKDGAAQRVGDFLVYDAAWYPDAERILYSVDGSVYSSDKLGKTQQRLFGVPGNAFWFRWAPDRRTLRFTVIDSKTEETSIWQVSADGKNPHRLFSELQSHLCCGTWTPDEKFYLFQARAGNTFQIWAQRVHPRSLFSAVEDHPFRLVFGATSYRGPVVNSDGSKLFLRAEDTKAELVRYDQHSGKFIPMLPSIPARTIAFSRDGGWIAYTSLADNDLWRCRSNGKECLQLTQGFKQTVMPRWSPDGRTIAFMGLHFSGGWGVYSVPADGGEIRSLSNGSEAQGDPDWSPDGQRLVFSDVRPVADSLGISVLDLRTNQVSILSGSAGYFSPRWSPDGRALVALHAGDQYLYLFDFGTLKWRRLTSVASGYPGWSQDGKYVYFSSSVAGDRAVFRVAATGRAVEKVADLAGVEQGSFFMSDWIGLAPDDTPLAVHDLTTEDIYAWDLIAK